MTIRATCMVRSSDGVRLRAVDAQRRVITIMTYDLPLEQKQAFVPGREYVVTIEEAPPIDPSAGGAAE